MLRAFRHVAGHLEPLPQGDDLALAIWIDLYSPTERQVEQIAGLSIAVPTLADMEEIEISNRLYREGGMEWMTVVLPGQSTTKQPIAGPVTFILSPQRVVTVRHHAPRPFETYPERADRTGAGCATPDQIFLGLTEEITGRLADLLEGAGKGIDAVSQSVFRHGAVTIPRAEDLRSALERVGQEAELLSQIRLALLTLGRAIGFFGQTVKERPVAGTLKPAVTGLMRDIQALEVHTDYLSSRVTQVSDAVLGMINLNQNATIRIVSVVAVLFLPPTLIASVYGMNFAHMPELAQPWGYPVALVAMAGASLGVWAYFRWKNWL